MVDLREINNPLKAVAPNCAMKSSEKHCASYGNKLKDLKKRLHIATTLILFKDKNNASSFWALLVKKKNAFQVGLIQRLRLILGTKSVDNYNAHKCKSLKDTRGHF